MTATDVCEVERLTRALETAEQEAAMLQAEAEDAKDGALEVVLEAAQDRAEVQRLRAQLAEAQKVSEAAHYCVADPDCQPGDDDPTCPEYFTDGGESPSGIEYCSHVEHHYATWADRYARERLDEALRDIRQRLAAGEDAPAELVETIDDTFEALRYHLSMEVPEESGGGWSAYTPHDIRAAAAERDAARERWEGSDSVTAVHDALERASKAEHEASRLKRELATLRADLDASPVHVMDARESGWTLKHPLSCRPRLFDCPINRAAEDLDGPVAEPGRWVVELGAGGELRAVRSAEEVLGG